MRGKRLARNTIASLIFEIATIVCGFIVPRFILGAYGSEVNGLVNSITQFLTIISFMELGVGAVVQSALYGPLARKDHIQISRIIASAQKFFHRIAMILLVYVVILMIFYPNFANQDFGWLYTALLIAVMSISSFAQYYFGIANRLLLNADQHGYIQYTAQTVTLVLNTIACIVIIRLGAGIHFVRLATSVIYLFRPLFLWWYVNRHYQINRKIQYSEDPIKQKWNGVAQHVSAVVLDGTDTIVLTIFSTLANVSIYSVYNMVVYGVKRLLISMTNGMQALLGEMWAKNEAKNLRETFSWFEWILHTGTVFVFGCTGMLLVPFITVYTSGITDANYMQPVFAVLLTVANAGHCMRLPYNVMILAAGHYKQTQHIYIIAAILNIGISVLSVIWWGLIGVAMGTLVAMFLQTIWMAIYNSKHLISGTFKSFLRQIGVDAIIVLAGVVTTLWIPLLQVNYGAWVILAIEVVVVWAAITVVVNMIFCRTMMMWFFRQVRNRVLKRPRDINK